MNASLKRFIFLAYALHLMEQEVDMDEAGMTVEMFQRIDELLAVYLGTMDPEDLKEELIELVKELSQS